MLMTSLLLLLDFLSQWCGVMCRMHGDMFKIMWVAGFNGRGGLGSGGACLQAHPW